MFKLLKGHVGKKAEKCSLLGAEERSMILLQNRGLVFS